MRRISWLFLLVAARTAGAAPQESGNVQASLMAESESIRPGRPLSLGVRLQMAPGWMTYWKNPGDAGLATRVSWTLPEGFTAGPIEWPHPQRVVHGPLASYGYQGDVVLLTEVRPPASLPVGAEVMIAARVNWLECKEACLPGRADLTLRLPVRSEEPRPSSAWGPRLAAARRQLPKVAAKWKAASQARGPALLLSVQAPPEGPSLRTAFFFCEDPDVVEPAAPQNLVRTRQGYRLEIKGVANPPRPFSGLRGVLVGWTAVGGEPLVLQVDAPDEAAARTGSR